jgi:hypothetical protein
LSAIRESELAPLLAALQDLDLGRFEYVSIHAPSAFSPATEACIFEHLYATRNRQWPIVVHPDTLHDFSLWKCLGHLLCIENMDQRKPIGRTARELDRIFDQLPDASFCLDVAWRGHSCLPGRDSSRPSHGLSNTHDQIPDEIRRVRTALETHATMALKEQP